MALLYKMDDDSTYVIIKKSNVELYINMNESQIEPDRKEKEESTVTPDISTNIVKNGIVMISESRLSEDQKKLAAYIYDSTKKVVQSFILDSSFNNAVKITMMIGQVMKQLENVKMDGKAPTGSDKKVVAIQLGRILIKEITPDDKEVEIFILYDTIAEPTLEAMIDVSNVVNVQEISSKCCPKMLDIFKKIF